MSKRDTRYELIRTVSMLFVISAHVLSSIPRQTPAQELTGHVLTTLFCLCNGLFFMLSGKFSLNARCESLEDYLRWYAKRLNTIGIPALFFMLLRTMHNSGWWPAYLRSPELWQDYLHNILSGFRSCDYWFLYPLTGLLAAAPFLSKLLQRLNTRELLLLLGIGMGFNALSVYLPALGLPFAGEYPLGGWFVLFLLGYSLERIVTTPRAEWAVLTAGGVCFLVSVAQQHIGFAPGVNDLAPTYVFTCSAAFLGLKKLWRSGPRRDRLILAVGRHSLSVYLCHAMILSGLETQIPAEGLMTALLLRVLATALLSLVAAFVLDRTLFALLQLPLRRLLLWHPQKSKTN